MSVCALIRDKRRKPLCCFPNVNQFYRNNLLVCLAKTGETVNVY